MLLRSRPLLPAGALLVVTAVWGSTFFLLKDLLGRLPVTDLLAVRFALAALILTALFGRGLPWSRQLLRQGTLLGLMYGVAQILQTVGLAHTAASVSGFLTGLYVVATPLLARALLGIPISSLTWLATGLATAGLAVLSLHGFSIGYGELLTTLSAVIYAGHILALGRLSEPGRAVALAVVQTIVIALVCTVAALADGSLSLPQSPADWGAVVYLAAAAGALTMVLQTWAQARMTAARAAVLMAMEPVWAAGFAVALGGEPVTVRMVTGGAAILGAMLLVELAPRSVATPAAPADDRVRSRAGSRRAGR